MLNVASSLLPAGRGDVTSGYNGAHSSHSDVLRQLTIPDGEKCFEPFVVDQKYDNAGGRGS